MVASRIAFYGRHAFYRQILSLVQRELPADIDSLLAARAGEVVGFRPHVLLLAAHDRLEYFRSRLPATRIGNVRHGLVTKTVLLRTANRLTARQYDFLCCGPDEVAVDAYRRAGAPPTEIWRTGSPQLDALHRRDPVGLPDLPRDRPTILYAPTWNLGLSSVPMVGEDVVRLIRRGVPGANVIIKPHPMIADWRPGWLGQLARAARHESGVLLVDDAHGDVTRYMLAADLLVSDASSVIFQYLALDRPIVVLTNPLHRADVAYDPADLIWQWRAVAREVIEADDLPAAVAAELAQPNSRRALRQALARQLFAGQTDGRNALRVATGLAELARRVADEGKATKPRAGLPLGRWLIEDVARSAWQAPLIRRTLVGPFEAWRLARRAQLLRAGRLRSADGRPIPGTDAGLGQPPEP